MRISVIIVGIGQWKTFTRQAVQTTRKFNPNAQIIVVDNGSQYSSVIPLYIGGEYGIQFVRSEEVVSYAAAINLALPLLVHPDWVIILNNDVVCTGNIESVIKDFDKTNVYGNKTWYKRRSMPEVDTPWIDGWLYCIPYQAVKDVGEWDENFLVASHEDVDFSIRAFSAGYSVHQAQLPFEHLEYHIRKKNPEFKKIKDSNKAYLYKKHGL